MSTSADAVAVIDDNEATTQSLELPRPYEDSLGLAIAVACLTRVHYDGPLPTTAKGWYQAFVKSQKVKDCEFAFAHAVASGLLTVKGVESMGVADVSKPFFQYILDQTAALSASKN
jgi:hypothetical protein